LHAAEHLIVVSTLLLKLLLFLVQLDLQELLSLHVNGIVFLPLVFSTIKLFSKSADFFLQFVNQSDVLLLLGSTSGVARRHFSIVVFLELSVFNTEVIVSLLDLVQFSTEFLFSLFTLDFLLLNFGFVLLDLTVIFEDGVFLLLYQTLELTDFLLKFRENLLVLV
jgi:hypothetical protein